MVGTVDVEINLPYPENPELVLVVKVFFFSKAWSISRNVALLALATAKNSAFLVFTYPDLLNPFHTYSPPACDLVTFVSP